MKLRIEARPAMTMEVHLICNCCRQPYHSEKCWQDQLNALIEGQEKFAICPVCTQAPPPHVYETTGYKRRCLHEVKRIYKLWENDKAAFASRLRNKSYAGTGSPEHRP